MKGVQIGIIAEDISDVEVLKILVRKLTSRKFSSSHFVGKGCGSLARKVPGWCNVLAYKGCDAVVLVHDRDKNNLKELRDKLEAILTNVNNIHVKILVIPTEEIEAWFLSDLKAVKKAMNLVQEPKKIANPEKVTSPKEHLKKIIKINSKNNITQYVNAIHNPIIANHINVKLIAKCCPSFYPFTNFVTRAIQS